MKKKQAMNRTTLIVIIVVASLLLLSVLLYSNRQLAGKAITGAPTDFVSAPAGRAGVFLGSDSEVTPGTEIQIPIKANIRVDVKTVALSFNLAWEGFTADCTNIYDILDDKFNSDPLNSLTILQAEIDSNCVSPVTFTYAGLCDDADCSSALQADSDGSVTIANLAVTPTSGAHSITVSDFVFVDLDDVNFAEQSLNLAETLEGSLTTSFTVASAQGSVPVITVVGSPTITLNVGDTYNELGATATDVEDTTVDVTFDVPVNTNIANTYTVTYTATDSDGNTVTATRTVQVNAVITTPTINTPPTITTIADKSLGEGSSLSFEVEGNDVEGDTITYTVGTLENWMTFTGTTFTASPGYEDAGKYTITFTASDGTVSATETLILTVNDVTVVNTPPVVTLTGVALQVLNVGDIYNDLGATATDTEDPSVAVIANPTTINTAVPGTHTVTYTATDDDDNTVSITRIVRVNALITPTIASNVDLPLSNTFGGLTKLNFQVDEPFLAPSSYGQTPYTQDLFIQGPYVQYTENDNDVASDFFIIPHNTVFAKYVLTLPNEHQTDFSDMGGTMTIMGNAYHIVDSKQTATQTSLTLFSGDRVEITSNPVATGRGPIDVTLLNQGDNAVDLKFNDAITLTNKKSGDIFDLGKEIQDEVDADTLIAGQYQNLATQFQGLMVGVEVKSGTVRLYFDVTKWQISDNNLQDDTGSVMFINNEDVGVRGALKGTNGLKQIILTATADDDYYVASGETLQSVVHDQLLFSQGFNVFYGGLTSPSTKEIVVVSNGVKWLDGNSLSVEMPLNTVLKDASFIGVNDYFVVNNAGSSYLLQLTGIEPSTIRVKNMGSGTTADYTTTINVGGGTFPFTISSDQITVDLDNNPTTASIRVKDRSGAQIDLKNSEVQIITPTISSASIIKVKDGVAVGVLADGVGYTTWGSRIVQETGQVTIHYPSQQIATMIQVTDGPVPVAVATCGNNIIEGSEECDGPAMAVCPTGKTGLVTCNACQLDTTACVETVVPDPEPTAQPEDPLITAVRAQLAALESNPTLKQKAEFIATIGRAIKERLANVQTS